MGADIATVARKSNRGSKPGERRGGRVKGTPNKVTAVVKDMVVQALDQAGGVEYLVAQANDNPAAFLTLVGKVIPLQVHSSGPDGGPIEYRIAAVAELEELFGPTPHLIEHQHG
jgi:hypothetical protein